MTTPVKGWAVTLQKLAPGAPPDCNKAYPCAATAIRGILALGAGQQTELDKSLSKSLVLVGQLENRGMEPSSVYDLAFAALDVIHQAPLQRFRNPLIPINNAGRLLARLLAFSPDLPDALTAYARQLGQATPEGERANKYADQLADLLTPEGLRRLPEENPVQDTHKRSSGYRDLSLYLSACTGTPLPNDKGSGNPTRGSPRSMRMRTLLRRNFQAAGQIGTETAQPLLLTNEPPRCPSMSEQILAAAAAAKNQPPASSGQGEPTSTSCNDFDTRFCLHL